MELFSDRSTRSVGNFWSCITRPFLGCYKKNTPIKIILILIPTDSSTVQPQHDCCQFAFPANFLPQKKLKEHEIWYLRMYEFFFQCDSVRKHARLYGNVIPLCLVILKPPRCCQYSFVSYLHTETTWTCTDMYTPTNVYSSSLCSVFGIIYTRTSLDMLINFAGKINMRIQHIFFSTIANKKPPAIIHILRLGDINNGIRSRYFCMAE